ncbi:MAG: hypothetical protein OXU76_03340, partial [Alphaproteobacteria bacterium]|nr:hypothetical protein [Alphaproteobacteria bacterium]
LPRLLHNCLINRQKSLWFGVGWLGIAWLAIHWLDVAWLAIHWLTIRWLAIRWLGLIARARPLTITAHICVNF